MEGRQAGRMEGWRVRWSEGSAEGWMVAGTDGWVDLERDDDDRDRERDFFPATATNLLTH